MCAGLGLDTPALTVDRGMVSGLDAILLAERAIASGQADCVIAGGAEALSTAPWRVARPRRPQQLPRFLPLTALGQESGETLEAIEALETLARRHHISRADQDAFVMRSMLRVERAASGRRLNGEIVPIRHHSEEMRDEPPGHRTDEALADAEPYDAGGTVTSENMAEAADGAAFAVVVSEGLHENLGRPPALRVAERHSSASDPGVASGAASALDGLRQRCGDDAWARLGAVEISETSAIDALVCARTSGIDEELFNADGGAVVRGHAHAAAGAILVARLFTQMIRAPRDRRVPVAAAVAGSLDGLGTAMLIEAVL
jgi:acetyl-CoA C-acetyltransferase